MVRRIHVVVVVVVIRIWLWMGVLRSILVHLHVCKCRILGSLGLLRSQSLLLLLGALLCHTFKALLLLNARRGGAARARFQCHWWDKGTSELGLRDEWMQLRLRRRPSFKRIEVQQALSKINESGTVRHFYTELVRPSVASRSSTYLARFRSASCSFLA